MKQFNTHVYAVVRIKVCGTNLDADPARVGDLVADAVSANPGAWLRPSSEAVLDVEGQGSFSIECVEFAEDLDSILVDELSPEDPSRVAKEHHFPLKRHISTEEQA